MTKEGIAMTDKNQFLTPHNTVFQKNGDFPSLTIREKVNAHVSLEFYYARVYLRRAFPNEEPYRYISVAGADEKEIGMIPDIAMYPEAQRNILKNELNHRYFTPKINRIDEIKDRFGHTTFHVQSDVGPLTFTVRDVYRNLFRLPDGRIILTDTDGNRFEITDVQSLDKKSYKRIELYI
jgi:hypothetical protein